MKQNTNINPSTEKTKDGSHTLYSNRYNQHYHNPGGAVSESRHVFFEKNGLKNALTDDKINILEIGFGSGLNLLLFMDEYLDAASSAKINYHTVEAFPISARKIKSLNYGQFLHHPELTQKLPSVFNSLKTGMNQLELLTNILVTVFYGRFKDYNPGKLKFDYIFHDAFSPNVNPELWTGDVFKKLLKQSRDETILTTYCAASKARAAMAYAGWNVARAPGASGKREMTIASPTKEKVKIFKRINEERLTQRFEEGDFTYNKTEK